MNLNIFTYFKERRKKRIAVYNKFKSECTGITYDRSSGLTVYIHNPTGKFVNLDNICFLISFYPENRY